MHKLYFDGGKKDSKISYGFVIKNESGKIVYRASGELEAKSITCNGAEYIALIIGLSCCIALGLKQIEVYGDSSAVINNMNNLTKNIKNANKLFGPTAKKFASLFESISFEWIPRKFNYEADRETR